MNIVIQVRVRLYSKCGRINREKNETQKISELQEQVMQNKLNIRLH